MNEDYVSFEVAKLLKEKEFDVPTRDYYRITGSGSFGYEAPQNWNDDRVNETAGGMTYVSCPTHQLAVKWLRIKHGIHIVVSPVLVEKAKSPLKYDFDLYYQDTIKYGDECVLDYKPFHTHEEAIEAALIYSLQNLVK